MEENIKKALTNFGIKVASVNEVTGSSETEFKICPMLGQDLGLLKKLKKDIAICLNVKTIEVETDKDTAILRIISSK